MTVQARFHLAKGDFTLDIDLTVPGRGVTAIYGPSGCGKTTLLRAIAGLESDSSGFVKVGDVIWQETAQSLKTHQRQLGYVFQEASLFSHLSVRENLDYGVKRVPRAQRTITVEQAIALLKIEKLLERKPATLSGGERQRVAIARALATSPRLLLMDEPFAAVDAQRKREILPLIETLHRSLDIPVIYVSHALDEVARVADHLVLLEDGRVQASGAIGEVLTRLDLPLAQSADAEAIIEATVAEHDDDFQLTFLDSAAGRFTVIRNELPLGAAVRLRLAARDVSLTLEEQSGTSILNVFAATVDEFVLSGTAQVTVRLLVGEVALLARVTRKSATVLDLKPGKPVYIQAKSVAVLA